MADQTQEMRGAEALIQGAGRDQIHLVVTEIITKKESTAKMLARFVIMSMTKTEMVEIEIETDTGLGMVIGMNVMVKIGIEIVMIVTMIKKNMIEKEIIGDHVTEVTETTIKIGIVTDMREIETGIMTTRSEQDIVENGVREAILRITTLMKLYTRSLSFLHVVSIYIKIIFFLNV